jgi:pyrimidine operon attenuation protein/uracil phosphoribosyltransferase
MLYNQQVIDEAIDEMTDDLENLLADQDIADPLIVGIRTGGVWIAERLHRLLDLQEPLGVLDITFYRDDFSRVGRNPIVQPSDLPYSIDDRHILLVDDVLHTGRTIRAAMNELFDFGRPASVMLATLVNRSGRELPIEADVYGLSPELEAEQSIKLTGPDPLSLILVSRPQSNN